MNSIPPQFKEGSYTFIGLDYLAEYDTDKLSDLSEYVMDWSFFAKRGDIRYYPNMKIILDRWVKSFE